METPFAYYVYRVEYEEKHVGVFRRLRQAVAAARATGCGPDELEIDACYEGAAEVPVPPEWYSRPNLPSREEALEFIQQRQRLIDETIAEGKNPAFLRARGCMRCSCDDPEDKQVADYIKMAPRIWLEAEEVRDES